MRVQEICGVVLGVRSISSDNFEAVDENRNEWSRISMGASGRSVLMSPHGTLGIVYPLPTGGLSCDRPFGWYSLLHACADHHLLAVMHMRHCFLPCPCQLHIESGSEQIVEQLYLLIRSVLSTAYR